MAGFRFLVRTDAEFGHAMAAAGARLGSMEVRLKPLFPNTSAIDTQFGIAGGQAWFIAESASDFDPALAWDECHARIAGSGALGFGIGASYAEPDWPQSWLTEDRKVKVSAFGTADACTSEVRWMENPAIPHGNMPTWHLGDDFTGLAKARQQVQVSGKRRVRIGHLDTGYTDGHALLPEGLDPAIQKNFVAGENPNSAIDPFVTGVLKNPGHGTGTICILAGGRLRNLTFPDENTGDYLGGAPHAQVIPVRIAPSVVLFYTSAFALGLDYLLVPNGDPALRTDVISMSMGGLASGAWTDIINHAYDLGVVVCTAAGNNIGGLPTHNIVYPARYRRVTAVCAVMENKKPYWDLGAGVMAGNWGPQTKMATAIAAFSPNIPWASYQCRQAFNWDGQGTSAATPQVAAAAALYIQTYLNEIEGYSEPWMKVEAVRKALFDGAHKLNDLEQFVGNGVLDAAAMLQIRPALEGQLTRQDTDSASFPFLRVITGLGLNPTSADMLRLEIVQLTQQSSLLQDLISDPDLPADKILPQQQKVFLEAVIEEPKASKALRTYLGASLGGRSTPSGAPQAPSNRSSVVTADNSLAIAQLEPPYRKLRGYAFDPSISTEMQYVDVSETVYRVAWEAALGPGPTGEYLEVVDYDYSANSTYNPVDLNHPHLLAQDGLAPSEGNPQFHQQMVYAVAMGTIAHFEAALGRKATWASDKDHKFVQRLTLHPHAMCDANAFYSPDRKAILFGYFNADPQIETIYPGSTVYTALSHDIVAHETTHALLDGMHQAFREPSNPDVLAFHEAFADTVALFQQFANEDIVASQSAAVRGDLSMESLLGNLGRQFGLATTGHAALRSAYLNLTWDQQNGRRLAPSPKAYQATAEPHKRGAVLLAAIYGAFLSIYRNRTSDLVRIATSGSGVLPSGALHPALVHRLSKEAARSARHVLRMCIRALDYCPPVDITFGEFLRAIITADYDVIKDDDLHYRIAFVESFRAWGIYPPHLSTLSVETLLWKPPALKNREVLGPIFKYLDGFIAEHGYARSREDAYKQTEDCKAGIRTELDKLLHASSRAGELVAVLGLRLDLEYEITRLRIAQKITPDGNLKPQAIVSICQEEVLAGSVFPFRGGVTLIADLRAGDIPYCVLKLIQSDTRRARQLDFARSRDSRLSIAPEPFAFLHSLS